MKNFEKSRHLLSTFKWIEVFPDFITFFRHHIVRNDNQIVGKYIWVT